MPLSSTSASAATILAKRKQLETFIDKNRARASTASQARSKSKQLERLELLEIEGPESTVRIRATQVEPRKGPAARCVELAIGYSDHPVADGINLEVPHGARVAVVGDNGQGKTTFLRTLVDSLNPLVGEVRWGHGCDIGTYAQHVYTSLPESSTIQEYLQDRAAATVRTQTILDVAGSFLFRGELVEKRIAVLSGGERARLCLAGLLLGRHNVLVLDEPGNHLDVDTVEVLADALVDYRGTIVFTSHDRYFMQRVELSRRLFQLRLADRAGSQGRDPNRQAPHQRRAGAGGRKALTPIAIRRAARARNEKGDRRAGAQDRAIG